MFFSENQHLLLLTLEWQCDFTGTREGRQVLPPDGAWVTKEGRIVLTGIVILVVHHSLFCL